MFPMWEEETPSDLVQAHAGSDASYASCFLSLFRQRPAVRSLGGEVGTISDYLRDGADGRNSALGRSKKRGKAAGKRFLGVVMIVCM